MARPAPGALAGRMLCLVRGAGDAECSRCAIRSVARHSRVAACRVLACLACGPPGPGTPRITDGAGLMSSTAGQSRAMSFAEAVTNVMVGFVLAILTQLALFPL